MYLSWLRNGFTTRMLSWLLDIPKSTVSRYLVTWTNLLYFSLGKIVIWPPIVQVLDTIPETFRTTYPSDGWIIDRTEIFCQRPSSLSSQSATYSNYKHHVTYMGIAPSGAFTFISELYEGSISDKVIQSSLNDSIMASRGLTIHNELPPLNVELNIPSFLGGRVQLTEVEVKESQTT